MDDIDPERYSSHLPVLRSVIASVKPERILEFGAGLHSTPLFCKTGARVVSVEVDPEWRKAIAWECDSPNLVLRSSYEVTPADYDLIFIDDGESAQQREKTIRLVLSQPHPVVVIHDAEVPEYRQAIEELAISHKTYKTDPDTCVVWE